MKREYPKLPIVGVGGVVIKGDEVLLVRRGKPPMKGRWTIPGGMVELGESLPQAVQREINEETRLEVRAVDVIAVLDRIFKKSGRVRFHYVIVDYACRVKSGKLRAASDVLDARWVKRTELSRYRLPTAARSVIRRAFERSKGRGASAHRLSV